MTAYIVVFIIGVVAGIVVDRWFINRGLKALKDKVNKI